MRSFSALKMHTFQNQKYVIYIYFQKIILEIFTFKLNLTYREAEGF